MDFSDLQAKYGGFQKYDPKAGAPKTSGRGGFATSLISETAGTGGALGGAAAGAGIGSFLGPIGTVAGGLIGGAIGGFGGGFGGRAIENKIRDDEFRLEDALQEGLISGAFGAAGGGFRAAKGLKAGANAVSGAAKSGAKSKIVSSVEDKAAASFLNLSPAQTAKLLDAGVDPKLLAKTAAQFGDDAVSIIGRTGKGGPLQETIRALEQGIQSTAKTAGRNVRIDADTIIKGLKAQRKELAKQLGSESKVKALDKIIADASKKYAKGVSVNNALSTLRTANSKFGASILDDTTEAVAKSAQKLEANALREALKSRFPGIGQALDKQSELIQLREVLSKTRGADLAGKVNLGRFDLTKPGTFVNPVLTNNKVTGSVLRGGPSLPSIPGVGAAKTAGRALAPGVVGRGLTGSDQPTLDDALLQGQTGFDGTGSLDSGVGSFPTQPVSQSPYSRENLLYDIQRDPKNADKYIAYFQELDSIFGASSQEPLNSTAAGVVADTKTGLEALAGLKTSLAESGANAPFIGGLRAKNPFDTEAQNLQAQVATAKQIVGKALEGGVLRKEDEVKYAKLLPTVNDTDAVAQFKISELERLISGRLNEYLSGIQGGGGGQLEDALLQLQGAQ